MTANRILLKNLRGIRDLPYRKFGSKRFCLKVQVTRNTVLENGKREGQSDPQKFDQNIGNSQNSGRRFFL